MANVIIKSQEHREQEQYILKSFQRNDTTENRETAAWVAARTREAYTELERMDGKKR